MAEFRTPFFHSFLINDPALLKHVLNENPKDFPKSGRIGAGLKPLLGNSVFLTNGAVWEKQRRIIDPAFAGGRLRDTFAGIMAAGQAGVDRIATDDAPQEIESLASHIAADVIFRTLFSVPIEDATASQVFEAFQEYQRSQPILNLAAFIPGPRWMPRLFRKDTKRTARGIRKLITDMTRRRLDLIASGQAPNDLSTKILSTKDPRTGVGLNLEEMVDQVAIFFLAGHETSASALSWALYLLALNPEWQDKVADEARAFDGAFAHLSQLRVTRDVFRETLRLYPPVPMMVRHAAKPSVFRKRKLGRGAQVVISPWHLHRHTRLWDDPDAFDPSRWQTAAGQKSAKHAYLPFSTGPRVCTGAGFAMIEGVSLLATLVGAYKFELGESPPPVPVAHLTVRARDGIWLKIRHRRN